LQEADRCGEGLTTNQILFVVFGDRQQPQPPQPAKPQDDRQLPPSDRVDAGESGDSETGEVFQCPESLDLVSPPAQRLRYAINELCPKPNARSLGNKLKHLSRRIVGGKFLDSAPGRSGYSVWVIQDAEKLKPVGDSNDCGDSV
jgi:hypothetical protein